MTNETKNKNIGRTYVICLIVGAAMIIVGMFGAYMQMKDMTSQITDLKEQVSQLSEVQKTNEAESVETSEMLKGFDHKYVRYSLYVKNDYIIDEGNFHYVIWSENVKVDPNNMDYDKQRTYSIENSENCGYILLSGMEDTPILIKLVPEG